MTNVKLSPLRYIDIDVGGRQCKGLIDSGAEFCLISEKLTSEVNADECGLINVRGIFGDSMRVPLVSVNVKGGDGCNYDNAVSGMQVVCAVAPLKEMSHSMVLSSDVAADLEGMPATGAVSERVNEVVVDCCMSASCDYVDNVVNPALDRDDAGEPDGSNVDVRVDQLLSGDDRS